MEKLTPKEQLVYDFIVDTIRREGYSPSVRDITQAVSMKSTSTVHHYINRLEAKGYIQKESGKSRTLRVENKEQETSDKIPVLGRVAAGQPILATENFEGYVDYHVNKRRYNIDNLFALIIKGESMIEAGIMNGDTVIVERTSYARNGDIVIALVGDEATCKEFYREDGHYRLQPRNSTMDPIIVKDVVLLGKVIASYRNYN
ncbi:MAG: transcriptional repressor LexA [Clostridia bacterium]|nr:transcriptional repressor LexA [Clostridia bacterium]